DLILIGTTRPELGGSEALAVVHDMVAGPPPVVDIAAEVALARLLCEPIVHFAHDISDGGLGVALAQVAMGPCGVRVSLPEGLDPLWGVFGESTGRAIVSGDTERILASARAAGLDANVLGRAGVYDGLEIAGVARLDAAALNGAYRGALPSV